jgi:hypothetical protein
VKSVATTYGFGGGHRYRTASCHSRGSYKDLLYTADDIDFLVAYIVPRDVCLVPVKLVPPVVGMCFYPWDAEEAVTTKLTAKPGISWRQAETENRNRQYRSACPQSVAPGTTKPTQSPGSKNPRETNHGGRASRPVLLIDESNSGCPTLLRSLRRVGASS